jgi:hypothetical protein
MNLITVKIGHITDTLHGKLFSLLHGVPIRIALTKPLREKQKRNLILISVPLKYVRFDTPDTLLNYDFKVVLFIVNTHTHTHTQ